MTVKCHVPTLQLCNATFYRRVSRFSEHVFRGDSWGHPLRFWCLQPPPCASSTRCRLAPWRRRRWVPCLVQQCRGSRPIARHLAWWWSVWWVIILLKSLGGFAIGASQHNGLLGVKDFLDSPGGKRAWWMIAGGSEKEGGGEEEESDSGDCCDDECLWLMMQD